MVVPTLTVPAGTTQSRERFSDSSSPGLGIVTWMVIWSSNREIFADFYNPAGRLDHRTPPLAATSVRPSLLN
jgi:hypothetical protein